MVKAPTETVNALAEFPVSHFPQNVNGGSRADALPQTEARHHARQVVSPFIIARRAVLCASAREAVVILGATKLSRVSVKRGGAGVSE
jgi:hypothetical protein